MGARTIGTIAGAVVGAVAGYFIGPIGPFLGASIGATLGGVAGGLYETANLDDTINKQETIADLRIQTSTLGQTIPQLFGGREGGAAEVPGGGGGAGRLAGNVIWATEKAVHEHRETQQAQGGKGGGGPSTVSITKTYSISLAIALCDTRLSGPMSLILRVWKNATLIYDVNQYLLAEFPANWTFYPGTADQLPDPTIEAALGVGEVPGYRYLCYIVLADEDLGASGQVPQWSWELGQAGETLSTIMVKLCDAAQLTGDAVDLSGLPEAEVQMTLTSIEAVRAPIEQLALVNRFYGLESGTQFAFRQVGAGSVVATIPEAHTSAGENQPDDRGPQLTRVTTLELPTIFYVTYVDPAQNWQRNTQPSTVVLPASGRENPKNLSVALAMTAVQARQLANELLVQAWVQRESYSTTVPRQYAYLEPGDKIEVMTRGLTYPLLLAETTYGDPGLVELVGKVNASPRLGSVESGEITPIDSAITGAVTAPPGVTPPMDQTLTVPGDTTPLLLNLPVLSSSDQAPRYHVAYVGENTPWPGGILYRSVDGEATYQQVNAGALESYTGTVAVALPDVDWTVIDDATTLTVVLEYGSLMTINDDALEAGLQRAMIGDELVYIGVADLVAPLTYDCTHLWRGRQGTEWAVAGHGTNETFVLLDNTVHAVPMSTAERGIEYAYKGVTIGQAIADADTVLFTPTAENFIPWQVLPPLASRPVQDWQIRWYVRSRFVENGFDPDFVGFQVKIYSNSGFGTVLRTITTSGGYAMDPVVLKGVDYTAAQQVADFGSVQGTLYFTVAQVGAYATGRSVHRTSTDTTTVQGAIEPIVTILPDLTWVTVTGTTQAMAVNTGYITNNAALVTLTLPATSAVGDRVAVRGLGAGGWKIAQATGQQIHTETLSTASGTGGYLASNHRYDSVDVRALVATTTYEVEAYQGEVIVQGATQAKTLGRLPKRVVTLTDAATVTLNADTTDLGLLLTLSQATLLANPTGTVLDGQMLELRITSSTSRALTYGSQFRGGTALALPPSTTGGGATDYIGLQWRAANSTWDILAYTSSVAV